MKLKHIACTVILLACVSCSSNSSKFASTNQSHKSHSKPSYKENTLNYNKIAKNGEVVFDESAVKKFNLKFKEVGMASWYGSKFQGRKTANGSIFDKTAFSAAHKSMPMPSIARVTNLSNNSSVLVVINDRGPYHSGRVIDLSQQAAKHIGISGIAKVKVEYLHEETLKLLKHYPTNMQARANQGFNKALKRHMADLNARYISNKSIAIN